MAVDKGKKDSGGISGGNNQPSNSGAGNSKDTKTPGIIGLGGAVGFDEGIVIGSSGHTTGAIHKEILEVIEGIQFERAGVKTDVTIVQKGAREGNYTLAADTIVVRMSIGDATTIVGFINATDVNASTFPAIPVNMDSAGGTVLLDRYPSEIYDEGYELITSKIAVGGNRDVSIIEPVVLRNFDKNVTEWMGDRITKQLTTCLADVQVSAGAKRLATSRDIADSGDNVLDVNIQNVKGSEHHNEYGIPINPIIRIDLATKGVQRKENAMGSLNTGSVGNAIAKIHVNSSVLYTGSTQQSNNFSNKERYQSFSPNFVMTSMETKSALNFSTFALALASMAAMTSMGVMLKSFVPDSLAVLELEVNSSGLDSPGIIDPKDMQEHYPEYFQKFFKPEPIISVMSTPGTTDWSVTALLEAASSDQSAHDVLVNKFNDFTNGEFSKNYTDPGGIITNMEYIPMGTFQDPNNKIQSLDQIDLLYVLNAFPGQREPITRWVRAMSGTIDPLEARAIKLDIINRITHGAYEQLDHAYKLSVNGNAVTAILHAVKANGINLTSNSNNFNMIDNNFVPYNASGTGVNMGSSGLFGASGSQGSNGSIFQQNSQWNHNRSL